MTKNRDLAWYKGAYRKQIDCAIERNIEWQLTFDEWLNWWGDDLEKRGPYKGQLVMGRKGDVGPYHLDNIFKIEAGQNAREARLNRPAARNGLTIRKRRQVSTPAGVFESIAGAAQHYGITPWGIRTWTKTKPNEFKYLDYVTESAEKQYTKELI